MRIKDEHQRYVEYFQRQLVRPGTEEFLGGLKKWFEINRISIADKCLNLDRKDGSHGNRLASAVLAHQDIGDHDSFFSRQIFEPLLAKIIAICTEIGTPPRLPIRFANSPAPEPSPAALPSANEHILFAGPGTFAFCNYWGKVFSTAFYEIGILPKRKRRSVSAISRRLAKCGVVADATRLAIRYAATESLLGFGRIEQHKDLRASRVLLVNSMEAFILAHEVAHFISHEEYPNSSGIPPDSNQKQLELNCDALGFAVCNGYGAQENNPFAFQLIGPVLFFYALRLSDITRSILTGAPIVDSETHPSTDERIRAVLQFLKDAEAGRSVQRNVLDALDVAMIIGSQVQVIMHRLVKGG